MGTSTQGKGVCSHPCTLLDVMLLWKQMLHLGPEQRAETFTAPGEGKFGGPQQPACTACPGDLHCPGIIIPSAFAADFLLFQLWSSHPSDPGVQRGRQWVSYTCAAKCTTAPGQFLHAVGMVQRGAHGCNCLTRAGQGEPSTPHVPAQLSSIASATKWHILPPSPGEKEDIQWVFEVSWC